MDITVLVNKIKSGELSAVDLVTEHFNKAETTGKELNAIITMVPEAISKAKKVDEMISNGEDTGLLAGIPFTAKDVIMTKGIKTTASSRFLEDHIAQYSAHVIEKLEAEGAILIAKTNSDPFAFGGSGENSGFGPTLNPIDIKRTPGGSSSGAAALAAANIGLFALGTDTGGSVRQPASFTGTIGFKPSYGRDSRYGLIAMASSFDTVGVFAGRIEDVALVEWIIAGRDVRDATTYDVKVDAYNEFDDLDLSNYKFALPNQHFAQGLSDEVKNVILEKVELIKQKGGKVEYVDIPELEYGISVYYILVPAEISSNMARFDGVRYGKKEIDEYHENMVQMRGKYFEEEVKRRILIGTYVLSAGYSDQYYKKANYLRSTITKKVKKVLEEYDVILGPTAPTTAFKLGDRTQDPVAMYLADVYTVIANITGMPAISLPAGFDSNNLPIGIQFMTDRFEEKKLFNISNQFMNL